MNCETKIRIYAEHKTQRVYELLCDEDE